MRGLQNRNKNLRDLLISAAWHGAIFGRMREMPSHDEVMGRPESAPDQAPAELRAQIFALNELFGGDVIYAARPEGTA